MNVRQLVLGLIKTDEAGNRCTAVNYRAGLGLAAARQPFPLLLLPGSSVQLSDSFQVFLVFQRERIRHVRFLQAFQAQALGLVQCEEVTLVTASLNLFIEVLPGGLHPRLDQLLLRGKQSLQGSLPPFSHLRQLVSVI